MLKNKFKITAFLLVLILALTFPIIVRADNETTDTNVATPDANATTTAINTTSDDNFKRNDVYLMGEEVTIDYIIDGNLFVLADHVTINSQIGGDAFICANTITVGEQGYVFSNLFTFAKNVNIHGVVYDLYAASENTTINGYVYRDIHVGSNTVEIAGMIGRNAFIDCENLNFIQNENTEQEDAAAIVASKSMINGNLTYSAKQETSIPEGAIKGETKFEQQKSFSNQNTLQDYILAFGTFVITVVAIWLLGLWLAPKFLKNTASYVTTKKILPVIGFGILTPIVAVFLSVLLLILGITSKLAIMLLAILFVFMAISTSITVITINNVICDRLKTKKMITNLGMLIACSTVLWLISLIPYVGSIVGLIVAVLGLGIIISSFVLKEKSKKEESENPAE